MVSRTVKSTPSLSSWCSGMSNQVTCAMCGIPVDEFDTVEMPNGMLCLDPCYLWLEAMMDEIEPDDDEDVQIIWFEFDDEDE